MGELRSQAGRCERWAASGLTRTCLALALALARLASAAFLAAFASQACTPMAAPVVSAPSLTSAESDLVGAPDPTLAVSNAPPAAGNTTTGSSASPRLIVTRVAGHARAQALAAEADMGKGEADERGIVASRPRPKDRPATSIWK